jgi:hypothetical protein
MQKYSVNQRSVDMLLHYIKDGEIVIPEIQRPFVWKSVKVRDLMDSLYQGFPIGYIITWKNPNIRLKNGELSGGKQVLIDGQQRITALMAAVLGQEIVDENYKKKRIFIAFHPLEEKFETLTPAIKKSSEWISDISEFLTTNSQMAFLRKYLDKNKHLTEDEKSLVEKRLEKLSAIKTKDVGIVELDAKLDIEDVTEIFVRINSAGIPLEQADFAMSKIASYEPEFDKLFGVNLRKCVDYFAHLAKEPHFFEEIERNDSEFNQTEYLQKIKWLKNENDDLYDPDYKDILRVSFVKEFERGKISDLVKLLSGQNFETREFDEKIQEQSFLTLKKGILDFVNENHFKKFLIIVQSAGIINSKLINSQNVLNFAYIVYLHLRKKGIDNNLIEKYTRKWLVISILTERYSGSPESTMDKDIKDISKKGIAKVIEEIEEADLSDNYWKVGLVQDLRKATISNPFLKLFFTAQIYFHDKALFSESVSVQKLIEIKGDIHHIFPKNYLQKAGLGRGDYNQIANFVYLQQEVNVKVGAKAPKEYFGELLGQVKQGNISYGLITDENKLLDNLKQNAIPENIFEMDIDDYEEFLEKRRKLMAEKIEKYYKSL